MARDCFKTRIGLDLDGIDDVGQPIQILHERGFLKFPPRDHFGESFPRFRESDRAL